MADAVGAEEHVKINSVGYNIVRGTYNKRTAPEFIPQRAQGALELTDGTYLKPFAQTSWINGRGKAELGQGQEYLDDPFAFWHSENVEIIDKLGQLRSCFRLNRTVTGMGGNGVETTHGPWILHNKGAVYFVQNDGEGGANESVKIFKSTGNTFSELREIDDTWAIGAYIWRNYLVLACNDRTTGVGKNEIWLLNLDGTISDQDQLINVTQSSYQVIPDIFFAEYDERLFVYVDYPNRDTGSNPHLKPIFFSVEYDETVGVEVVTVVEEILNPINTSGYGTALYTHNDVMYLGTSDGSILFSTSPTTPDFQKLTNFGKNSAIRAISSYFNYLLIAVDTRLNSSGNTTSDSRRQMYLYNDSDGSIELIWNYREEEASGAFSTQGTRWVFVADKFIFTNWSAYNGVMRYDGNSWVGLWSDGTANTSPRGMSYSMSATGEYLIYKKQSGDDDTDVFETYRGEYIASNEATTAEILTDPYLETSWFDSALPSIDKIAVDFTLQTKPLTSGLSVKIYYKINGASSYTLLGTYDNASATSETFAFPTGATTKVFRKIRIKLELLIPDGVQTSTPIIEDFVMRYLIDPTDIKLWDFTVDAQNDQENITIDIRDGKAIADALWTLKTNKQIIDFVDVDGTSYKVYVLNVSEPKREINLNDGVEKQESQVNIQLLQIPT